MNIALSLSAMEMQMDLDVALSHQDRCTLDRHELFLQQNLIIDDELLARLRQAGVISSNEQAEIEVNFAFFVGSVYNKIP